MRKIGKIGNYYGGLFIKKHKGKYYWIIENYDTDFKDISEWEEISEAVYNQLNLIEYNPLKLTQWKTEI